ncbi:hypothetical protein AGRHK599_LOCUS1378 [Rhizobium rhizogenes]|uniref:DUF2865 domain-containing protein n=1 Tax=Rhizobium rhizogenes TaxID=359 RepID=A0AAN2A1U0_RHIRH|nr:MULTISPECIES: DUF2865 domain-containing protein [Rhizobium/Agrobacterium group]MCZ7443150.1 DUF2865 domain-containing protein [Rhizobium rhizogenes]NSZ79135.1 DUF2865 domain-containing protein [Agrobacterium tumefaciens]OAM65914.1 hypothetical protein A8L48_23350 [Rhizobium rhizogenes]CAD0211431.1 hypothetical protein AGRHK599_LOCUS1378 [Rhizobium rhizogenes]
MTRRSRIIGLLLPLVFLAPAATFADQVCDTLYAQLREPPRVIGNTAEVRRYANALARQNIVIRKIRNDLRSYGCSSGSVVVYGNPNAGLCTEIGDALADAEAERDAIIRDRDDAMAAARSDDGDIRRQRILAALDANGCSPAEDINPQVSPAPDVRRYPDAFRQNGGEPGQAGLSPYPNAATEGGLRTLCVRTCDGSFFPIASNASPLDFRAQAEQCQKMCPGTQTELYFHSMTDQETADMVSAETGKPYKDLPTAFAYRNASAKAPGCACNMAAYHEDMQKQEEAARPESEKPYSGITRIPSPQGDKPRKPAEQQAAKPPEQPVPERDYDPNDTRVRVIGPKFLPDQTGRIDLKNPALKGIQPQQ